MQNAKDSFYVALRDRLAVLNPARVVEVRGALRPAVIVAENELVGGEGDPLECFVLVWGAGAVDATEPMPLCSLRCQVRYSTRGTGELTGMDRGRVLDAMDGELRGMLLPAQVAKVNYTTTPQTVMATEVFWSAPEFGVAELVGDRVTRVAVVDVFALREAGE